MKYKDKLQKLPDFFSNDSSVWDNKCSHIFVFLKNHTKFKRYLYSNN